MSQIFTMDLEREIKPALRFSTLLRKHGIKGEFYITGAMVEQHPNECREIAQYHTVGGHGYHHENFAMLSIKEQEKILQRTLRIFNVHKIHIQGWRFPGLNFTNASMRLIAKRGLFDSSIQENVWNRYGRLCFIRNAMVNLKNGRFILPVPFPRNLHERPWSHADLNDRYFYKREGRLMLHCYHYHTYEQELQQWLVRS